MKTILYIIIFNFSMLCFAQDPQLFEQTWYCQNLIFSGEINTPPANAEVPFVPLNFTEIPMEFTTSVCNSGSGLLNLSPVILIFLQYLA